MLFNTMLKNTRKEKGRGICSWPAVVVGRYRCMVCLIVDWFGSPPLLEYIIVFISVSRRNNLKCGCDLQIVPKSRCRGKNLSTRLFKVRKIVVTLLSKCGTWNVCIRGWSLGQQTIHLVDTCGENLNKKVRL
jgi:hypothetical protein